MASALFEPFARAEDGARWATPSRLFWNGSGPFGGWVAAVAWRAMAEEAGAGAVPRSLSVHFHARLGPAPFELRTATLSQGSSVTGVRVDLCQHGRICVTANAVFGRARPDFEWEQPTTPLPTPASVEAYEALWSLADFPQQFDYRIAEGFPFSDSPSPVSAGWLRLRGLMADASQHLLGPAELLLLADAWFPPVWTMLKAPLPVSTLSLDVVFLRAELAVDLLTDGFLAAYHSTRRIADGYADEQGLLCLPDGSPVLRSQQLTWVGTRVLPRA